MAVLVALFVVGALVELAIIVQVAQWIGVLETLALLLAVSFVGAWLVKRQGVAAVRRVLAERREGRVPGTALADAALIAVAGALLLVPGFVTDGVGLLLLVPTARSGVRTWLRRRWTRRVERVRDDLR